MLNSDLIWKEGRYIDFWSIPHIIIGALLVWIFEFVGFGFYFNLGLSFVLILGWEFFELYALDVHEHFPNKFMDVITGIFGFFIMYYFIQEKGLMSLLNIEIFLGLIYLVLCGWGLGHYYRKKNEKYDRKGK